MLILLKIFISTGIIFGFSQAGKIVTKTEPKDLLQASSQETKIYGGRITHIHEAPYQVYFRGCSGAIISLTFVITAAHCLPNRRLWDYPYYVRVGSANRTTGGQFIQTKQFIPHPKYNPTGHELIIDLSYDIGLVELTSPIKFNENASAIELATQEVPVGEKVMISGWGYTSRYDNQRLPQYLQSIEVPIINRKTCRERINEWGYPVPDVTDLMICNYELGKETCKGDSGGPLVFNKTLVGIVSWGYPNCSVGPGVNINVAHPEIQAFIKSNSDLSRSEISNHNKIVGGVDTDITKVPYTVALEYRIKEKISHSCGGIIISETRILTAAHCLLEKKSSKATKNPKDLYVRVGSSRLEKGGEVINVTSFVIHPKYNLDSQDYDVGIVKLSSPISLNEKAQIISLTEREPSAGEEVLISGWGKNDTKNNRTEMLQSVKVNIRDRNECMEMMPDILSELFLFATNRMICGYLAGHNACEGDSGGPVVLNNTVVGIVSWGAHNCEKGEYPSFYVNVANDEIQLFIYKYMVL